MGAGGLGPGKIVAPRRRGLPIIRFALLVDCAPALPQRGLLACGQTPFAAKPQRDGPCQSQSFPRAMQCTSPANSGAAAPLPAAPAAILARAVAASHPRLSGERLWPVLARLCQSRPPTRQMPAAPRCCNATQSRGALCTGQARSKGLRSSSSSGPVVQVCYARPYPEHKTTHTTRSPPYLLRPAPAIIPIPARLRSCTLPPRRPACEKLMLPPSPPIQSVPGRISPNLPLPLPLLLPPPKTPHQPHTAPPLGLLLSKLLLAAAIPLSPPPLLPLCFFFSPPPVSITTIQTERPKDSIVLLERVATLFLWGALSFPSPVPFPLA